MQSNYPLIGGLEWFNEYTYAQGGLILSTGKSALGGHCIKLAGFTTINNLEVIILQNSWGTTMEANGCYYMTRQVFNQAFADFGIFVWSDSTNFTVKTLGMISALYYNIITLLSRP